MDTKINKREQRRNNAASDVCKEVRHQISKFGGVVDNTSLFNLLEVWMNNTGKEKYNLPKKK